MIRILILSLLLLGCCRLENYKLEPRIHFRPYKRPDGTMVYDNTGQKEYHFIKIRGGADGN